MSEKHTPIWTYEVHELSTGFSAIVYDEHGHAVADHLSEDIARLIAAAPDLLEALEHLLKVRERDNGTPQSRDAAEAKARRAIAKARGEQP